MQNNQQVKTMNETESKTIAVVDHERATKHSWIVTKIPDVHPATSKGYAGGDVQYTLIGPGMNESSYDLHKLKSEVPLTGAEHRFLQDTDFDALEDGETYRVNGHK